MNNQHAQAPSTNPGDAAEFAKTLFGHDLLQGLNIGGSLFPPKKGTHGWHKSGADAAAWATANATTVNVYFRMTPVREPPAKGRGNAKLAAAIVGVHGDVDILDPVHKKTNLPCTTEEALQIIDAIGIEPTIVVSSGHGLQPHFLLTEPFVFDGEADHGRATVIASRFDATMRAAAQSLGFDCDPVGDLARILRVPGTMNLKSAPVPVGILSRGGPRYTVDQIEAILIDPQGTSAAKECGTKGAARDPASAGGFSGSNDQILGAARRAKNRDAFSALFDQGDTSAYGGDHSKADWHLVDMLAFWCGPSRERIDRLFRRSKLMRSKWDEVHAGDGETYGAMTISDVLATRKVYFKPRLRLALIVVSNRQLRDQTGDALEALDAVNTTPVVFQRGGDIVRVRTDEATGRPMIQRLGVDEMVGLLTRSADYVEMGGIAGGLIAVKPPQAIARDILALPKWRFPALVGVVESPRVRPDGSILTAPGYDPPTKLWLAEYEGWRSFDVPLYPTQRDLCEAVALLDELFSDFPFVGSADRANVIAFLLTPILRPAIAGSVPVCAFDALSKQGTGKSLLLRTSVIAATGREPALSAIPDEEAEWRKSITAALVAGREVIAFDNASGGIIESGTWANAVTAVCYDDRILGVTKRVELPVRCTWGITGNAIAFGPDMARRTYQVLLDAGVERPEERAGFRHELPAWAIQNRLALVRACLVLCRAYWSNGCPVPRVRPLGSFEDWTRIVGGVLEHARIPGFLDNQATFRINADTERGEWHAFVAALAGVYSEEREFTTSDVVALIERSPELREALPTHVAEAKEKDKSFSTRLGKALRKHTGAVFGAFRLEHAGTDGHTKKTRYRVVVLASRHADAGGAGDCGGSPYPPTCEN